jgi:hypothetical protein
MGESLHIGELKYPRRSTMLPPSEDLGRREHWAGLLNQHHGAMRVAVAVPVNTITVGVVAGGTGKKLSVVVLNPA